MNKRITALGLTAGLLAGAGAGFLLESSGSAGAAANGANVAVVGAAVGATASTDDADRAADRAARLQEVLQPLVDDGTLTQAQADEVVTALQAAGPMGGDHGDRGGEGGKGGPGRRGGANLDEVATLLGITPDEMKTALQGGQTLAELAVANGTTAQDVIDLLVADVTAHLAEEVAAGEHTQTEADAKLADATTRITEAVNNGGPMGGGRGGPGGRHGHDGPTTATTATTTTTATTATTNVEG